MKVGQLDQLKERVLEGGAFPAITTATIEDTSLESRLGHYPINIKATKQVTFYTLDGGCDGVAVVGCTGQSFALEADEKISVVREEKIVVANYNAEHGTSKLVIAGDGLSETYATVKLAQRIEKEAGVYLHLIIIPFGNKPPQRGLIEHYTTIADNIDGLIMLYNVPGRAGGIGLLPETIEKLARHEKIIALKEANPRKEHIKEVMERTKGLEFAVYSGNDNLNIYFIEQGGIGAVTVGGNVDPRRVSGSIWAAKSGNWDKANRLHNKLDPLYEALFLEDNGNPVMVHYALRKIGIDVGVPRSPLGDATDESKQKMDKALTGLGLIGAYKAPLN